MCAARREDRAALDARVDELVWSSLRAEVARRAQIGQEDAGASTAALAALLEDDELARGPLDDAADARRRRILFDEYDTGPRQRRVDREAEVHAAVGRLTLRAELVADGLDRVVLPGYGVGTWRAIAALREHPAGSGWAAAVAAGPAADLGEHAPRFLRQLDPDPRLSEPAAKLHMLQAHRQDVRNALMVAEFAIGVAMEAENTQGIESLSQEAATCARQLEFLDREIDTAWADGERAALSYAPAP